MSDPVSVYPPATEMRPPMEVYVVRPPRQRLWVHVVLLLLTFLSTLIVGSRMQFNYVHHQPVFSLDQDFFAPFVTWIGHPSELLAGIPFSLTLMFILLAHEMGHYLYSRHYRVYATLPFFIPFPSLIGTLGAFIRIKSPIPSRAALFDIGIAGPIAGFVIAVLVLVCSLLLSHPFPPGAGASDVQFGMPLIFHLMYWVVGLFRAPGTWQVPLSRVSLHPTGIAAWVGMFATALNLLPGGQLDGGHIVYAVWPRL